MNLNENLERFGDYPGGICRLDKETRYHLNRQEPSVTDSLLGVARMAIAVFEQSLRVTGDYKRIFRRAET